MKHRCLGNIFRQSATLGPRHDPNSMGRQQWGISNDAPKSDPTQCASVRKSETNNYHMFSLINFVAWLHQKNLRRANTNQGLLCLQLSSFLPKLRRLNTLFLSSLIGELLSFFTHLFYGCYIRRPNPLFLSSLIGELLYAFVLWLLYQN